jgi:hypothetical protein
MKPRRVHDKVKTIQVMFMDCLPKDCSKHKQGTGGTGCMMSRSDSRWQDSIQLPPEFLVHVLLYGLGRSERLRENYINMHCSLLLIILIIIYSRWHINVQFMCLYGQRVQVALDLERCFN